MTNQMNILFEEVVVELSDEEILQQKIAPDNLKKAILLFKEHGFLKIDHLFSKEFIRWLAHDFADGLEWSHEGELTVGAKASHKRFLVPVPFRGPFNSPRLYANPILMPLLSELLGQLFIIGSMGAVTSLPGAEDQHIHTDYYPLFEEDVKASYSLPCFGITMAIPLVDINLLNGPTKIWSGSHRTYPKDKNLASYPRYMLFGDVGSCYFWDYRTFHAGGSNYSSDIRPLLYLAYTRQWFNDHLNQDHLLITEGEFQKIPEEHKRLFIKCRRR